jgi:hypothetical protein
MKYTKLIPTFVVACALALAASARAQIIKTWTGGNGSFYDPTHWDVGTVPGVTDIALINNGSTATIAANAGTNALSALRLGDTEGDTVSGHVIMNGGHLNLGGTVDDPKAVIGFSTTFSSFVMNGGTIFFDGPDMFPGSSGDDGLNGLDWEVGEKGFGRFEMHNNAVFRGGDDLKVGASATGNGSVLIDGNARLSVGSGISVSEGGPNPIEQLLVIGGNAVVDSGNSMGAGSLLGSTDEGYLTMAAGVDSTGRLIVQDDAVLNFRRLSAREGNSIITVRNRGQVHIFDVLHGTGGSAANRPVEMGPNSTLCSAAPSTGVLTLQDDAQMTVNSDPTNGPTKGLAISGPRDAGNTGGTAILIVRDRASFSVVQDLALGTGSADTSDGTLEVVGPNAKVSVGGNLSMAVDLNGDVTLGRGTLSAVITGTNHATVNVTNIARIANGNLKVTLSGYTPAGGENYTLITAASFDGQFLSTNLTAAPLAAGLSWQVQYNPTSVVLSVAGIATGPRVITVTTTNNTATPGLTNLTQAIQALQDGDVIRFDIPGAPGQVHYLQTPVGGYPIITNNNATIDGYSQPGASPNTNSIHAANNAKIKICLDSRNGNATQMDYITNYIGVPSRAGYGDDEWAVLGVFGGTNFHVKGLAILSSPLGSDGNALIKSISFARSYDRSCADWHVSGCWIGVDPADGQTKLLDDGTTIAAPGIAIAAYRHRDVTDPPAGLPPVYPQPGTIGVKAGSTNPRAEFNVIINGYGFDSEGLNFRISGNFWGVQPDGMTNADFSVLNGGLQLADGYIEIGRDVSNTIIGTDGDGINDADEGNVFGGFANGGANIMNFYSSPHTNITIAGNWCGVAVDGITRFDNSSTLVDGFAGTATVQFGSDFDGVSDSIEANVVYNNKPTATAAYPIFVALESGTVLSLRGNSLINNYTPPVDPIANAGQLILDYYAKAVADTNNSLVPVLSTNTTTSRLVGTVPLPNPNYPVVIVDVYIVDPEGITNGIAANIAGLPDGFIQGKTYLGSYAADGSGDLDLAPGAFEFDISSLNVPANSKLTITANYSKDAIGTHNGTAVTSLFSVPGTAKPGTTGGNISIGSVVRAGSNLTLNWTGGTAPFLVQRRSNLSGGTWASDPTAVITGTNATVTISGNEGYFRVQGQ